MVTVSYKMSFAQAKLLNASVDCYADWLASRMGDLELSAKQRSEARTELFQLNELRKAMRA